jgi:hypothetical protein
MALRSFVALQEAVVEQCQQAGLVWGRELYIDGTKVQANASKDSLKPRFFVEAHLDSLFGEAREETTESSELESNQQACQEEGAGSRPVEEGAAVLKPLPTSIPQELHEDLCQQNTLRHDWIEQLGAQDRRVKGRNYQRMADYFVSTTDPDATLMETTKGADMGYRTHYVVDEGLARIILGVLVTPSEVMDNQPMRDLIFRTRIRRETAASPGDGRHQVWHRRESCRHPATSTSMPTFPFLITIIAVLATYPIRSFSSTPTHRRDSNTFLHSGSFRDSGTDRVCCQLRWETSSTDGDLSMVFFASSD